MWICLLDDFYDVTSTETQIAGVLARPIHQSHTHRNSCAERYAQLRRFLRQGCDGRAGRGSSTEKLRQDVPAIIFWDLVVSDEQLDVLSCLGDNVSGRAGRRGPSAEFRQDV